MKKKDLIARLAEKANVSKVAATTMLEEFQAAVIESMTKGESVVLQGFGTFSVTNRSARKAVNPNTKEVIEIPARKAIKFKVAKAANANLL